MKKLIALFLALMMLIGLAACANNEKGDKKDKNDNPPAASQQQEEEQDPQEEPKEEEPDPPAEPIGLDITLNAPNDDYEVATIMLSPDFTFEMTVNLLEGFGRVDGTYTIKNGIITCNLVNKNDLTGFTGQELETFNLEPQDAHSYVIMMGEIEGIGALKNETPFYQ
jgi:hypothetical protein